MQTKLYSPPGFGEILPLDRKEHRFAYPNDVNTKFLRQQTVIPLTSIEFASAVCHYPIVFVKSGNGEYQTVAVTGIRMNENVFVDSEGHWRSDCYVPAYARAYPLCIAEVLQQDEKPRNERLVCIAKNAIVNAGVELFTETGEPTEFWKAKEHFLQEFEEARTWTQDMCRLLQAHNILVPFAVQADMTNSDKHALTGMYRIDEALLGKLTSYQLRQLIKRGWLQAIYAHLISLRHFQNLLGEIKPALQS
jgi:hypothetical protein